MNVNRGNSRATGAWPRAICPACGERAAYNPDTGRLQTHMFEVAHGSEHCEVGHGRDDRAEYAAGVGR